MTDDLKARLLQACDGHPFAHWTEQELREAHDRIAELEQWYANACQREDNLKDDLQAVEAECERLRRLGRDQLKYTEWFRSQLLNDHPTWPSMEAQLRKAYGTALAADQQQKGERGDGMADVSWKRQLERTRDDAWNAAMEAIATEADTVASAAHASSEQSYQAFGECLAATDLAAAARNFKRDTP